MCTAYIGMGSNVASAAGPPEATLAAAAARLSELGLERGRSSLYSTAPIGYAEQPRFVNAVVALETELAPRPLLDALLALERAFGRDRAAGILNGPRTLDLDILLWSDLCLYEAGLQLPHPRLAERAFVLVPLNEIAPHLHIPGHAQTVAELLKKLYEEHDEDPNAVAKIESPLWRAGAVRAGSRYRPQG